MRRRIFVTFQIPGMHKWPTAPERFAYLSAPHRHVFHFRVEVDVKGANRDLEFIRFKELAQQTAEEIGKPAVWHGAGLDFGERSCEMIGEELMTVLRNMQYDVRSIEVSEDGENGAVVEVC